MFQIIEGRTVFVVDLPKDPKSLLPITNDGDPTLEPYTLVLNIAIHQGIVREPGKYAIEVSDTDWNVFAIQE